MCPDPNAVSCGPDWVITPTAGPCVCNGWNAFVTAEFLYWTARQDHLGFATKESLRGSCYGDVAHPDWNFRPAFKVGLGYFYDHDGWDLYINYTWFRGRNTEESISIGDTASERITPVGGLPALSALTAIEKATADWDLDFNVIDLELGRDYYISRCLTLRPYISLKGTWQDQEYVVKGYGGDELSLDEFKQHYWGIGMRAGINTVWHVTRCTSVLGEVAVTGLWEKFESKRDSASQTSGTGIDLCRIDDTFHSIKPVFEFFLGLRWETWACCESYHINLDAGWEAQIWSGQNQFFHRPTETRWGDLTLHGLTLRFRLDF